MDERFSLDSIRVSQDFHQQAGVALKIVSVACRKPNKSEFVRARTPAEDWSVTCGTYTCPITRDPYLISPELHQDLPDVVRPTLLNLCISRLSKVPFLWPIYIPASPNRWHESSVECLRIAHTQWCRVSSDMTAGCYTPYLAMGMLPEPEWPPEETLQDYIRLCFKARFVESLDHPLLQQLRGEV